MTELTKFQKKLMAAAINWNAYQIAIEKAGKYAPPHFEEEEKIAEQAFRALVSRAVDEEDIVDAKTWRRLCDIARDKTGMI